MNDKDLKKLAEGGMSTAFFEQEVHGTTKTFGRDHDISVVFQGDQACTDGTTIYYPALDKNAVLSHKEVMIGRGFVDHESGHIRHTDMDFYMDRANNANKMGNELLVRWFNCIEDVRIERLITKGYVGSKKNLSVVADAVTENYLKAYEKNREVADDITGVGPVSFTWIGRVDMDYNSPNVRDAFNTLPDKVSKPVRKWLSELKEDATTQDAYDLARRIVHDVENKAHEQPGYENKPTGEGMGEDKEAPKDKGDRGGSKTFGGTPLSDLTEEQREQIKREFLKQEKESRKERKERKGAPSNNGSGEGHLFDEDINDLVEGIFNELEPPEGGKYTVSTTKYDRFHRVDSPFEGSPSSKEYNLGPKVMRPKSSLTEYNNILAKSSGVVNVMRKKLERAIQAKMRVDWDYGKEDGRLDARRLTCAYNGSPNVFKRKMDAPALNTAVTVLVDHSGSMSARCGNQSRQQFATDVSVALYETLMRIGVPFEVLGWNNLTAFPTNKDYNDWCEISLSAGKRYTRVTPLHMYGYKTFEDNPRTAREVLPSMNFLAGGGNADGEAVAFAWNRLKRRPEDRKVLLVLSDGQPCNDSSGRDSQHLRNMVQHVLNEKADLVGIGIQTSAVRQYYPKWVVCNDLQDLGRTTIDMLAKCLMGDRFVCDNSQLIGVK